MQDHVFEFIEIEEAHGKFKLYMKESGHYLATFDHSNEAVNAATVVDKALWAKNHEHLVEPNI